MYRIGIDLGGTNTAAGLVDQNGQIIDYRKDGKINKKSSTEKHNSHDLTLDDFIFGEYTISYYGEWGYMCKKNGQLLWKKQLLIQKKCILLSEAMLPVLI